MTNQVVKWPDGQIIVRPGLVEDEIASSAIARDVASTFQVGTQGFFNVFGYLCSQTISSEGLPFAAEAVRDMHLADKRNAYNAFMKLPKALRQTWNEACETADKVSDYALGPVPLSGDAPKN